MVTAQRPGRGGIVASFGGLSPGGGRRKGAPRDRNRPLWWTLRRPWRPLAYDAGGASVIAGGYQGTGLLIPHRRGLTGFPTRELDIRVSL